MTDSRCCPTRITLRFALLTDIELQCRTETYPNPIAMRSRARNRENAFSDPNLFCHFSTFQTKLKLHNKFFCSKNFFDMWHDTWRGMWRLWCGTWHGMWCDTWCGMWRGTWHGMWRGMWRDTWHGTWRDMWSDTWCDL
jgi:hypothetical protein